MDATPENRLVELATTNANAFLDAYLEASGSGLTHRDTSELAEEQNFGNDIEGFTFTLVDSEGGGEGGGEYVHRIFEVKRHGKRLSHLRILGNYQSYNGTEFDTDWSIVYPHEVVVTQYTEKP